MFDFDRSGDRNPAGIETQRGSKPSRGDEIKLSTTTTNRRPYLLVEFSIFPHPPRAYSNTHHPQTPTPPLPTPNAEFN